MRLFAIFPLLALTFACDKKPDSGASGATSAARISSTMTTSAVTIPATGAAPPVAASATGSTTAGTETKPAGASGAYVGEYKAVASKLYVPEDEGFKGFKFRGDESSEGLGPGTLELTVAGDGRVQGDGAGALGALTVTGFLRDHVLTAILSRKTKDGGFTGTLEASESAGVFTGVIHVSLGGGNVLREAPVSLKKK
jgi:hypothetical protein